MIYMVIKQREINEDTIGYCGVFCAGCPSYHVGTCHGCRSEVKNQKRTSKWKCRKRLCCIKKNIYSCGDCAELKTCKTRKNLIKSYITKYNIDLDLNSTKLTELGSSQWLANQVKQYKCSKCNGVISPYDNKCIHCQK